MSETIYRKVAELISNKIKIPVDRIKPDSNFDDLGIDSLDTAVLLFELEKEFGVTIPEDEATELTNVRQVVGFLEKSGVVTN